MNAAEILIDALGRVQEVVHHVVDDLTPDQLSERVSADANTIAWLVWHLTRVQDDHVADVRGTEQVWTAEGFTDLWGLPFDPRDTGFGHSSDQVAAVRVSSGELIRYYDAVHERTVSYVGGLQDAELDRIVDERWDPPVSLGVRLVSVVNDDLQHAGQAAFIRGIIRGRA